MRKYLILLLAFLLILGLSLSTAAANISISYSGGDLIERYYSIDYLTTWSGWQLELDWEANRWLFGVEIEGFQSEPNIYMVSSTGSISNIMLGYRLVDTPGLALDISGQLHNFSIDWDNPNLISLNGFMLGARGVLHAAQYLSFEASYATSLSCSGLNNGTYSLDPSSISMWEIIGRLELNNGLSVFAGYQSQTYGFQWSGDPDYFLKTGYLFGLGYDF